MRTLDPPETIHDRRDAVLLRLREAAGDWVEIATHGGGPTSSSARYAVVKWKRYCRLVKWDAFEWKTHGRTVYGRFVGTRIVPAVKKPRRNWMEAWAKR